MTGTQAADRVPDRVPRRRRLRARPGRRGPDPVLRPVRAPRPAVLRQGLDRVRRPRSDHRVSKLTRLVRVDDPPVRRPGADDPRDRRHARLDARPARRRGLPGGPSPVHADARRPRARADDPHDRLARRPTSSSPACVASSSTSAASARGDDNDRDARRDRPPAADDWRIDRTLRGACAGWTRPRRDLPPDLARRYGADLAIPLRTDRPTIVSNFVSTIDGVVAFDTEGRTGGQEVSGASTPDRS